MLTRQRRVPQLELCDPSVFGDVVLTCQSPPMPPLIMPYVPERTPELSPSCSEVDIMKNCTEIQLVSPDNERRRASALVDQLLVDIYTHVNTTTDYNSATSTKSQRNYRIEVNTYDNLQIKDTKELQVLIGCLQDHVGRIGSILVRQLKRRDALRRQREAHCDVITNHLRKRTHEDKDMRFSITPFPGDSGFYQWHSAMKMVAQLPEGIPPEFRRRLWLTLADRHLSSRGIEWPKVERNCFSEWSHPADSELGVQIVKDLHRTGCSLFCGEDGQENQALLKKVLLAYARWNKSVGYCQGFNMLAALILQVTEKCETDALKLMIYLIEGVLPDSYFADSLRGLSVDMAVFRELLRTRLPRLSRHLDNLQKAAKEGTTSYEPPLTNVFTMQWFLTLFCNCLPQETVLRVWDLILLEGNEILLRTALAIWQALAERILSVRSADEFYCIMGVLTREMLEFGFVDANSLIKAVVTIGPLTELKSLRDHYLYNINPWASSPPTPFTSYENDDKQLNLYPKEKLVLDIGALKKQYAKLKQRQRQAHIIFSAAVSRSTPRATPVAMNHLLLGKSALVPVRRLGPPQGAIPPPRKPPTTLLWKDAPRQSSSSSSSDTELCDDPDHPSEDEDKNGQLSDDNLSKPSDNENLMTPDNIKTESESPGASHKSVKSASLLDIDSNEATTSSLVTSFPEFSQTSEDNPSSESNQNSSVLKSDNFVETDNKNVLGEQCSDECFDSMCSEDGFDFEKFLEERIRCLKQSSLSSEDSGSTDTSMEQDRISHGRKNSERALEIIQENSLILHRILQCQRLSPISIPEDDNIYAFRFDAQGIETQFKEKAVCDFPSDSSPTLSSIEMSQQKDTSNKSLLQKELCSEINSIAHEPGSAKLYFDEQGIDSGVNHVRERELFGSTIYEKETENIKLIETPTGSFQGNEYEVIKESSNDITSPCQRNDRHESSGSQAQSKTNIDLTCFATKSKYRDVFGSVNVQIKTEIDIDLADPDGKSKYTDVFGSVNAQIKMETDIDPTDFDTKSKYRDILEYSKNLDEKYRTLILNKAISKSSEDAEETIKSSPQLELDLSPPSKKLSATSRSNQKFPCYVGASKFPSLFLPLDKGYKTSSPKDLSPTISTKSLDKTNWQKDLSPTVSMKSLASPTDLSPTVSTKSFLDLPLKKSPSKESCGDASAQKSPNHIYNPFPVKLSSRQNKDIAVRLGLYKK